MVTRVDTLGLVGYSCNQLVNWPTICFYFLRLCKKETLITYHKNQHIDKAIQYATSQGWSYEKRNGKGHTVGILKCGSDTKCHMKSVWGTPRQPENHAKEIISLGRVDLCCTYFGQQYIGSHINTNASDTMLA